MTPSHAPSPLPPWLDRQGFPFTPVLVDVGDGERLSVTDEGHGHPVIFSHGTPTWSYDWRRFISQLSTSYRCVAPDHLGFGLSPRPVGADYGPEAHARRFGRLREALTIDRYSLVVHDFGGPFALDAALDHPEQLDTVILFNSFAWPFGDSPREARLAKLAGTALFRWLYRNVNMSFIIARSAWGDRRTMTKDTWKPYTRLFPDADSRERVLFALARSMAASTPFFDRLWRRLDRLRDTNIHLIWGMKDSAFRPSALDKFQRIWPHATVLRVNTAGHWPQEEQPELCVDSVIEALRRSSRR